VTVKVCGLAVRTEWLLTLQWDVAGWQLTYAALLNCVHDGSS
jgi:hypothetical protein